jgi:hypothetical protein
MKKAFPLIFCLLGLLCGCHPSPAQAPPGQAQSASLAWTASASCTTANPCPSHILSRVSVASASTPCPTPTGSNYTPAVTISTPNATAGVDSTVTVSGYYCWTVQAVQGSNGAWSAPSNQGVALLLTEPPLAPGAPSATEQTAASVRPALPGQGEAPPAYQLANAAGAPMQLLARVGN